MKSIFVIAETLKYEKHFLFEYPLTEEFFNYLYKIYYKLPKSNKIIQNNDNESEKTFSYFDLYAKSFTLERHVNQDFIFDIIINNDRFISFPIWFSKNEYIKRKKIEESEYLKNKINLKKQELKNEAKTEDKYILLNMFNIVYVFSNDEPMNIKQELFKSVYSNLESLSKLLLFEEYNKHYLGIETLRIIKKYQIFFTNKKTNITYKNFIDKFPVNNNLYNYIKTMYEGIKKSEIFHVSLYNIELNYYISMYTNQLNGFQIKPYHSLIITKINKLKKFIHSVSDLNPNIIKIISKLLEMKTLEEISLETDIELNFVMFFANQLVSWNLANKIFKFNNYSTFQISNYIPEIKTLKLNIGKIGLNQALFIINCFSMCESTTTLNDIYQAYFKSNDSEVFHKRIKFLVEKQYLVQTSIIIYSKLKIKNKINFKNEMMKNFCNLISDEILFKEEEKKKIEKTINKDKDDNNYYYEDFLKDIKKNSNEDFLILSIIKNYINDHLYINEISYYTGLKIKDILNTVNKYEYIFDLVVVPLYDVKK